MSGNLPPTNGNFNTQSGIQICLHVSYKVLFQERIVSLFGAQRLHEILNSPHPFILPFVNYGTICNIYIFILF